jgi:putative Mg2+ transporter-C (MgtC) family protein
MPLHPTWPDIALRLILTVAAGGMLGFNRGLRGHAAGLRTTILVALAASAAMVQANILLSVGGKAPDSFGVMDILRFPLGILTGVGFIGGGAILKRGDLVTGVTTAATLWVATVIGLCFGGGQIWLGLGATLLGAFTLWPLKWFDVHIPREHRATLVIAREADAPAVSDLDGLLRPLGYRARFRGQRTLRGENATNLSFDIRWRRAETAGPPWDLLKAVEQRYRVASFDLTSEIGR